MTPPTVEEALAYARQPWVGKVSGPIEKLIVLAEEVARLRADAGRHSLAQELTEALRVRGQWTPASTAPSSDIISAVCKALDTLVAEVAASKVSA